MAFSTDGSTDIDFGFHLGCKNIHYSDTGTSHSGLVYQTVSYTGGVRITGRFIMSLDISSYPAGETYQYELWSVCLTDPGSTSARLAEYEVDLMSDFAYKSLIQ